MTIHTITRHYTIILQQIGQIPRLFELPSKVSSLVSIEHPEVEGIKQLGWKWCAVPTITNFNLRVAGVDFVCCPFNGWFLDMEVCRNFFDRLV